MRESANVDVDLTLAGGDVACRVAEEAERIGAAVVVIARAKMQKLFSGLRTRAYAIVRKAPCPVIAV
jgi:hypothetical protein